jgi:ATP diphosphatase
VFGDATATRHEVPDNWETIKAAERSGDEDSSALAGVALALPALLRAQKIQKRAARTGFDWPDQFGARDKILEELYEVSEATSADHVAEEIGDLLFAVVNFARFHKVDAEYALKQASAKFERRFRDMEMSEGNAFVGLSLHEKEELWQQAKAREKI